MRYFLKLAYNGQHYFGWQIQANAVSVQEVLTNAIQLLLKEKINLVGAGRTDTGVHAKEFYAHFDTQTCFDPTTKNNFLKRLNSFLPSNIVIYDMLPVKNSAHARFDAISRTYKYYVLTKKDPFLTDFAYRVFYPLDMKKMNDCCKKLMDYTDFTSFSKVHTQTLTNNCKIASAHWEEQEDGLLFFEITADRFLRNMVRAIAGTLLDVGRGKLSIADFCTIIEQKDRCAAGTSVAAHALFLEKIVYPKDIWGKDEP
ncbi:MAG: tRNA pseudouridine(38-40) synthase TruA [Bacteroidales bacterium]|jgi:tRNA pseudouridine38-40 synthase|nr:tRNA pseudouridine(38-40) synthase TruA [Bacteroidales bacterium]